MLRFSLCCLLVLTFWVPLLAQVRSAASTPFDTVGLAQKRTLFAPDLYAYHAATQLSAGQVMPVLLQSPDSTVLRLARRARRRYWLPAPLFIGGYGLFIGGLRAGQAGNDALAGGLALGSLTVLVDGIVVGLTAPRAMRRAVTRYNQTVRYAGDAYTDPLTNLRGDAFELTEADTIAVKPALLGNRYTYRQLVVVPDIHLARAMRSVNEPYISEGIRQNQVIRGISGVVGGASTGYLVVWGMTRLLAAAAGYRVRSRTNPLLYASLGGVAATFVLGGAANRTTRRLTSRYNELLRTPGR